MNSTTKSQSSIAKFEEFFATSYKDDVFKILEKFYKISFHHSVTPTVNKNCISNPPNKAH